MFSSCSAVSRGIPSCSAVPKLMTVRVSSCASAHDCHRLRRYARRGTNLQLRCQSSYTSMRQQSAANSRQRGDAASLNAAAFTAAVAVATTFAEFIALTPSAGRSARTAVLWQAVAGASKLLWTPGRRSHRSRCAAASAPEPTHTDHRPPCRCGCVACCTMCFGMRVPWIADRTPGSPLHVQSHASTSPIGAGFSCGSLSQTCIHSLDGLSTRAPAIRRGRGNVARTEQRVGWGAAARLVTLILRPCSSAAAWPSASPQLCHRPAFLLYRDCPSSIT